MTPAEHYAAAEELLETAAQHAPQHATVMVASAQVHATLATVPASTWNWSE